jgi:TolB-like protein
VLALLLALAAADADAAAPVEQKCKAAVLDLQPGEGVTVERARSFTEVVASEVGQHLTSCTVLSRAEINALISFEVERQMSGCDKQSCLGEIADALGVDRVVLGTINRIDERTLVSLRLVDMKTMVVERRVTDSYAGGDDDAVKWIGWLAKRVSMADEKDAGPRPVLEITEKRATIWRTLAWTGVGVGGGALLLSGALGLSQYGISEALPNLKTARSPDRKQIDSLEDAGPLLAGGANLALYVGAGLVVVGGALFFLPGEERVTSAEALP